MMKNKKGLFWLTISIIVALFVVSIIASLLGLKFLNDVLEDIKWEYYLVAVITILAITFRGFVKIVLITLWSWIVAIMTAVLSLLKI